MCCLLHLWWFGGFSVSISFFPEHCYVLTVLFDMGNVPLLPYVNPSLPPLRLLSSILRCSSRFSTSPVLCPIYHCYTLLICFGNVFAVHIIWNHSFCIPSMSISEYIWIWCYTLTKYLHNQFNITLLYYLLI